MRFNKFLPFVLLLTPLASVSAQVQAPLASPATASSSVVQQHTFFSTALQREMPYQIVLPVDYASSQKKYPVLYLLHGWRGDETNWIQLTRLVALTAHYPLIIVLPRGENSWYVNSATVPKDRFGDFLSEDMIAEVDQHFRTIANADGRAIAGLSMGGYGSLLMALRHPGMFSFVGSVSGAFDGPLGIELALAPLKPSTDAAYGHPDSATRQQNNVDLLLATAKQNSIPYVFLECGTSDPLLESNRRVVREIQQQKIAYEYHEFPGAHTWPFWDHSLPGMFEALANQWHIVRTDTPPSPVPSQPEE